MKSLVKRAQRGDDQAFVELIEENKQAMYKVAVGMRTIMGQKIQKERKQKKRLQHHREQQQSMKTFWSC